MRVIKNLGGGKFIAIFEKKAQPDYKGTLKNGKTIIFEAKHTENDRIEQSRLTDTQVKLLTKYHSMNAQCYVLVTVQMRTFYFVPWQVWRDMKEIYGRKYMTIDELKKYQVPFVNGTIRFLNQMR